MLQDQNQPENNHVDQPINAAGPQSEKPEVVSEPTTVPPPPALLPVAAKADVPAFSLRETGNIHIDDEIAGVIPIPTDLRPEDDKQEAGRGEGCEHKKVWLGNLKASIQRQGMIRPIYVWHQTGAILDGVETFRIARELGLVPYIDFDVVDVDLPDIDAAKMWRLEWNIATTRQLPEGQRAYEFLAKYGWLVEQWKKEGRENQRKAGRKESIRQRVNWAQRAAAAVNVSATTIKDTDAAMRHVLDLPKLDAGTARRLHAKFLKMTKGQYPAGSFVADVKGALSRAPKPRRADDGDPDAEDTGAGTPAPSPKSGPGPKAARAKVPQTLAPGTINIVVNGDCFEVIKQMKLGDVNQFAFSPPYPYANVNYGYTIPWCANGKVWTAKMRELMTEMHRVLPEGGGIIINVDNARDPSTHENFNCVLALYEIAKSLGMRDWGEVIWFKQNIPGKKTGWGSDEVTCQRRNHEYVLAFFKGKSRKTAPTFFDQDKNKLSISTWLADETPGITQEEFWNSVWSIAPAFDRDGDHPAVYPAKLAYNMLQLWTSAGDVVCDPFCGRGTTLAVAAMLGRKWIGIEIDKSWARRASAWARDAETKAHSDAAWLQNELLRLARPSASIQKAKAIQAQRDAESKPLWEKALDEIEGIDESTDATNSTVNAVERSLGGAPEPDTDAEITGHKEGA